MSKFTECEHCGNTVGFVFGTCLRCGFNEYEKKFRFIKVDTRALYEEQSYLIQQHAMNTVKVDNERKI